MATIRGQHYRFSEIENTVRIHALRLEGRAELRGIVRQRQAGGCADDGIVIEGAYEHAVGRACIGIELHALVGAIAIVEIRPMAEHRDPQRCNGIEMRLDPDARNTTDPDTETGDRI